MVIRRGARGWQGVPQGMVAGGVGKGWWPGLLVRDGGTGCWKGVLAGNGSRGCW